MRKFKSLGPERLPDGFDAEIHGEDPIVNVEESKGRIVISYTFPGFYLVDDHRDADRKTLNFHQVNIKATGHLAESGKPLLPSFGRYVTIPFNSDHKLTVKKGNPVQFDDVLVLPAQEKMTDIHDKKHVFEYDKQIYARDELYPKEIVEVTGPFIIDDYCALLVHVRPLQYNPAKKKLMGYGNITVTIDVTPKREREIAHPVSDPAVNKEAFGNLFLNPGRKIEERLKIDVEGRIYPPFFLRGPEFLIIYHDTFKKAAEKLAKWKNRRGLITEIVSIGTVGNTVAQIKKYIRDRRTGLSRLRYVLLFGDTDHITPETVPGGPWGSNATDYYYSTRTDPTGTTDCVSPWLSIGRIPVRDEAQGIGVVDQIISYERNPPADSSYYQRMALSAFFQEDDSPGHPGFGTDNRGYLKTIEDIRTYLVSLGYNVERVYVSNNPNPQFYNDGTPIPAGVRAAIVSEADATTMMINATTEGQLIIGHRDHGYTDGSGWAHPHFTVTSLDSVTGNMLTIFFSINCRTGRYDLPAPTECFAEKNLRMKGAAPSLIAPTRDSETWLNNHLIKAQFDALFGGLLPTFPGSTASYPVRHSRLGDILNYSKSYLPIASTDAEFIKDHFEIYHVIGDPTIELWKELPLVMKIKAVVKKWQLDIFMASCPKGCVLTIWNGETLLKRLEPSSTHITIPLKDLKPTIGLLQPKRPELFVCFWAPGYRFCEVRPRLEQ